MILSRILLPGTQEPEREILYVRGTGQAVTYTPQGMAMKKGAVVRFDTYFNAFCYPKYLEVTRVENVSLRLTVSGSFMVRLICLTPEREIVLEERRAEGKCVPTVIGANDLHQLPAHGFLFFEIEALQDGVFHEGVYETTGVEENLVRVAVVICTYRREAYVQRNLERLQTELWQEETCPIRDAVEVFVVDNGQTLQLKPQPHVTVFPNRNFGGSGGFTRGAIEALRDKGGYTHVLFMDDDISFETEVLVKTIQILRCARELEQPLCIGGQMLIEDQPVIQFEAGSCFQNGLLHPKHQNLDLSVQENLLTNILPYPVDYNAWWYCCIPLAAMREKGLSMPFFIKTDDVEYGLRLHAHVLLMNGIGVWHMAFNNKYSSHLEYYIKRNELVVSALHGRGDGLYVSFRKFIRAAGKAILLRRTATIDFLFMAYWDYLKGPDFFLSIEEEQLNAQLIQLAKQAKEKNCIQMLLAFGCGVVPLMFCFVCRYSAVQREYQRRQWELVSPDFWCDHLGIPRLEL